MSRKSTYITRTVWLVSWVSLFTDISSEMLYPIMPVYLQSIGFTAFGIGLLEGFAEAIVSWSKAYFGHWSDNSGKRMPFVRLGYLLSALGKGILLLVKWPALVFLSRSSDRLGKGIRSAPRDALLVAESAAENRGKVFGFHRALDTVGACIGPLLAMLCLWLYPGRYVLVFTLALAPAAVSVLLTWLITEPQTSHAQVKERPAFTYWGYWKGAPAFRKKVMLGLFAFALANSSDLFLLMKAKSMGWNDTALIGLYMLYNLAYAAFSFPVGKLADRLGMKLVYVMGLACFIIVYTGFAFASNKGALIPLLLLYGLFAACNEGMAKAWISKLIPKEEVATSLGFYAGINGIAVLVAGALTGWLWGAFSPAVALFSSAVLACMALLWMLGLKTQEKLNAKA